MGDFRKHINRNDEIPEDLIVDYSEMILDSILEEGGLKEARIIKTLLSIYETGKGNKDYYATKKIYAFLIGCNDIAQVQPHRFINFLNDGKTGEDIQIRVRLIVYEADDMKKAERTDERTIILLFGNELDFIFYTCLHYMIKKCLYCDILELKKFKDDNDVITSNDKLMDSIVILLYIFTLNQYLVTAKLINLLKVSVKGSQAKF